MAPIEVLRHGHVNQAVPSNDVARALYVDQLGGELFSEWDDPAQGTHNALVLVGPVCIEWFAPTDPGGPMAGWIGRNGGGGSPRTLAIGSRTVKVLPTPGVLVAST